MRRSKRARLETQPRSHPERADVPPLGPVSVEDGKMFLRVAGGSRGISMLLWLLHVAD